MKDFINQKASEITSRIGKLPSIKPTSEMLDEARKEYAIELVLDPAEADSFYEAIKMAQRICFEHDAKGIAKHNSRLEDLREFFKILDTLVRH